MSFARRRIRSNSAGFTLVELLTVVAITGILAAIGVVLVKGHVTTAKAGRALVGIQAIRVAQEQYRAQGGQYLNCSSITSPLWYPAQSPGKVAYDWRQNLHTDWACWQSLGIPRTAPTQYGYLVNAGRPGDAYPPLLMADGPAMPTPAPDLWYVIQVKGDIDGDGVFMQGMATSYSGEAYLEREAE